MKLDIELSREDAEEIKTRVNTRGQENWEYTTGNGVDFISRSGTVVGTLSIKYRRTEIILEYGTIEGTIMNDELVIRTCFYGNECIATIPMFDNPSRTIMSTLTELIDDIDNLFHGGTYPKAKEEHLRGYRLGINDSAQIVWEKLSEVMKESE